MKKFEELYPEGYSNGDVIEESELKEKYAFCEAHEEDLKKLPIEKMQLSHRMYNCLRKARIRNFYDVVSTPVNKLLEVRNLSAYGIKELFGKLTEEHISALKDGVKVLAASEKAEENHEEEAKPENKNQGAKEQKNKQNSAKNEQKNEAKQGNSKNGKNEQKNKKQREEAVLEEDVAEDSDEIASTVAEEIPAGELPEGYYKSRFYSSKIAVPNGDDRAFARFFARYVDKLDEKCQNTAITYLCSGELCEMLLKYRLSTVVEVKECLYNDGVAKQKLCKHKEELCALLHFLDTVIRVMPD